MGHPAQAAVTKLAVLDAETPWPGLLMAGADRGVSVLLSKPGMADPVLEALAGAGHPVRTLHLVSHGAPGQLLIAGKLLDSQALAAMGQRWRQYLAPDATIAIYGCEAGRGITGRKLVEDLSRATGARVLASSTPTGAASLGGDWRFDVSSGTHSGIVLAPDAVSAFSAAHDTWPGLLATNITNTNGDLSVGSIRAGAAQNDNAYAFLDLGASATINLVGPLTFNIGSATLWQYTGSTTSVTIGGDTISAASHLYFQLSNPANSLTINSDIVLSSPVGIALVSSGTGTFNGDVSGVGTLQIANNGTAVLGTTTSAALIDILGNSTLRLGVDASYTSNIEIEDTATIDTGAHDVSFSGVVSDDGANALVKIGTGTLTLSGANTYSGTTTVSAGTLSISADNNLGAGALTFSGGHLTVTGATTIDNAIALGADTTITNSANVTLSGVVSGGNRLTKAGSGTLTLSGANTYSGGTAVNAGTLAGTTTSLQGAISNNATVRFDQTTDGTYAGVMSGSGSLTKSGSGTVTLSGTNTYTGGTTVSTGTLAGSTMGLQGAITNNATVRFVQVTDGTYAGVMSGTGALVKDGAGSVTLSGANTYTGATTIDAGTLAVNGSITSDTTVNNGGTLGGSGTITGNVAVNSGGTLAPGNSPGLLTIAGNLDLNPGSVTRMEINGTARGTDYDAIDVSGIATLDGTLDLVFGYTPTAGTQYDLINAGSFVLNGDATNGFATITHNLGASLVATPVIDPTTYDILVSLAQQSYVTAAGGGALTGNQYAVAANLDTFSTSGQAADLITALNTLSAGQLPGAFNSLSGVEHTFVPQLAFQASHQFHGLLGQRLDAGRDGGQAARSAFSGIKLAYGGNAVAGLLDRQKTARDGFWLQGLGTSGRVDGDGNATGVKHSGGGLALGTDRRLTDKLLAGLAFAYTRSEGDTDTGGLDVDSYQLAAYGRWQAATTYVDGMLGISRHRLDSRRNVTALGQQARADYDGDSATVTVEMGRPMTRGKAILTPYGGLLGMRVHQDGFTESGGGGANLSVGGKTQNSLRTLLGLRYAWTDDAWAPTLELAWVHEFGRARSHVEAGFAAAPSAAVFRVSGPRLARDRLALGLGLTAWQAGASHLDVGYRGEFARTDRSHALAVTYRRLW